MATLHFGKRETDSPRPRTEVLAELKVGKEKRKRNEETGKNAERKGRKVD
jgi:hypothetical protein